MTMYPPFTPANGASVTVSASTTSADEAITKLSNGGQILVTNGGSVVVFVRWGVGAQTATAADVAIPGGQWRLFTVEPGTNMVAALTASSTASVYFTPGHGG
jgi:formylmethanofuran dehydrogenase subunit D